MFAAVALCRLLWYNGEKLKKEAAKMQTQKLYYENCHLAEFSARVQSCQKIDKGYLVTLDRTAFYPEGGGQPCDFGTLGNARVFDVQLQGETVVHLCDTAVPVGEEVTGKIDWARRFHLMQQHTGEHIVSGIIHKRYGYHNVGFHMGQEFMTIDFDGPIPLEALAEIEREANRAVWKNLQVDCFTPAPQALAGMTYRTKKQLAWPVRLVQVPGYDSCACCGTHVEYTGQIGIIKLFSCVKFHQGVRIEMACGEKALDILSQIFEQNKLVSQAFSAKLMQTGDAAIRMNEALAQEKFRAVGLEKRLFSAIAAGYAGKETAVHFEQDLSPVGVRELCDAIFRVCNRTAAVFSGSNQTGYTVCLASRDVDAPAFYKKLCTCLSGKGGGTDGFFQGRVNASADQICKFFDDGL